MTDAVLTSEEQLDTLLREGRISPEDYDTLHQALSKGNVEEVQHRREATHGKLMKKWEGRQLGGVCAGLGDFFGLDPWSVRATFVLAFFVTGGTALFVYLVLYFTLPWAARDPLSLALDKKRRGNARILLASLCAIWTFSLLLNAYIVPRLLYIAQSFHLPRSLPYTFLKWAYAFGGSHLGLGLQVLLLGSVYLLYRMAPDKGAMRYWIPRALLLCVSLYFLTWVCAVLSFQHLLVDVS